MATDQSGTGIAKTTLPTLRPRPHGLGQVLAVVALLLVAPGQSCLPDPAGDSQVLDYQPEPPTGTAETTEDPLTTSSVDLDQLTIKVTPEEGPAPLLATFQAAMLDGSPLPEGTYSWDFGDETMATGTRVSHVYNRAATYTVTLCLTLGLGPASPPGYCKKETKEIYVTKSGGGSPTAPNATPVATPQRIETSMNIPVEITLHGTNKTPGQTLTFRISSVPSHGTLDQTQIGFAKVTYSPQNGFVGEDSFIFLAADDDANAGAAAVTINVKAGNVVPMVSAGVDQAIVWPANSVALHGAVTDDGLPSPPSAVSTQWTKTAGSGTVSFGDAASPSTTATFSGPGTYQLQLAANDGVASAKAGVNIYVLPAMTIQATPSSGTAPLSVAFAAMDGSSPISNLWPDASLEWSFGDGSAAAAGTQVNHVYAHAGAFLATLSFTTPSGGMTLECAQAPIAATSPGDASVQAVIYTTPNPLKIAPYTALFSGLDSASLANESIIRWDWDFGDASSADARVDEGLVVAHRYDTPGTYMVRLTVSTASGKVNSTTAIIAVTSFAGPTYYVDATSGSDDYTEAQTRNAVDHPWKTISKACSSAVTSQNNPCRILLKRGEIWTLSEVTNLPTPVLMGAYGTGPAPILHLEAGTLRANGNSWGRSAVIEDLYIRRPVAWTGGYDYAIEAFSYGCVFRRCKFQNCGGATAAIPGIGMVAEDCEVANAGARGGFFICGSDVVFRRNTVHDSGLEPAHAHGIYFTGSGADSTTKRPLTRNWLVENNIFRDCANHCIALYQCDGVVVRGNDGQSDGNYPNTSAPTCRGKGNGGSLTECWRAVVENNYVHNLTGSQGNAFFFKGLGDWAIVRNNVFANNLDAISFDPPDAGYPGTGSLLFANNTIYGTPWAVRMTKPDTFLATGQTARFVNNIIASTGNSSGCLMYLGEATSRWTFDNNRYDVPNNTGSGFNGGNFSAWQTGGRDSHGSLGAPGLDANFMPATESPCTAAGLRLNEVWLDYARTPRPSTPAVGACEGVLSVPATSPLAVSPNTVFASTGPQGGPLNPASMSYTLTNGTGSSIAWKAVKSRTWVNLSKSTGILAANAADTITISLDASANSLSMGTYTDMVTFLNTAAGTGLVRIPVSLNVNVSQGVLAVTQGGNLASFGSAGGPFAPTGGTYTLTNAGGMAIAWTATSTQPWISLSKTSGTLAAGASAPVTATINAGANTFGPGSYTTTLSFLNTTNFNGNAIRIMQLEVSPSATTAVLYTTPNPVKIAPYTALFSGLDSATPSNDNVIRWDWDFGDTSSADPLTDEGLVVAHRFDNPGTYTVRLTITTASGKTESATASVTVTAFAGLTYYLDATNGNDAYTEAQARNSPDHPWKTLDKPRASITSSQYNPCRILLKRGETWTVAALTILPTPCMLGAYGEGPDPIIQMETNATLRAGGEMWGKSAVFEDLDVRRPVGWTTGYDYAIEAFSYGCIFRRCKFLNCGGATAAVPGIGMVVEDCEVANAGARGGVFVCGSDVVFRRNNVHDSGLEPAHAHGIYFTGTGADPNTKRPLTRNWLVENNTFRDCANHCIALYECDGVVVRGNDGQSDGNYPNTSSPTGRGNGNGGSLTECWRAVVENNYIHNLTGSQGNAFFFKGLGDWAIVRNNVFANNLDSISFDPPDTGNSGTGFFLFANNTIYGTPWTIRITKPDTFLATGRTASFVNNIVACTGTVTGCLMYLGEANTRWSFDYNRYDVPNNTGSGFNGGNFSAWQAVQGESHSSLGAPGLGATFAPTADSPCKGAGLKLNEVWMDYTRNLRPSTPAIGALE